MQRSTTPSRPLPRTALSVGLSAVLALSLSACQTPPQRSQAEIDALKRVKFVDTKEGARAVLDNAILFATDSYKLYPQADGVLDALKPSFAKARGDIVVEGHTDSTGRAEWNKELSLKRAEAVKAALIARQVPPSRIKVFGHAATRPVVANARTEAEHAPNRRAEILFAGETVESIDGRAVEAKAQGALDKAGDFFKGLLGRAN